ncbi:2-oxoacid:ferredoxin oxidoreductase subunit beta [Salinispira pacifica]|uniref:2-oxoglutarate oxidoreductase, beta subunit n=1 Tax=Salinispira pacifica TaxID=1307761 RepID=V5WK13_9SPIO|nr:2-oxoacid:ferredoxin oxidoreductase subunit beta [Salinispira pacifica]AHC16147.1 2-oxoglutarate oxidoreductase, beta subunit [Salinispira pacifica]
MKKQSHKPETAGDWYKKPTVKPIWCPGCGDYAVYNSLLKALKALEIPKENVAMISGIGCSGRFSHYFNVYGLHGTHGRALPTACGVKAARPDLTVFAVGGDGDGLSIGGGHIVHAARKNVDLTYIIMDNNIYGLTKGQTSPTTEPEFRTKTTPFGPQDDPLEPIPMYLSYGISFIARVQALNQKQMLEVMTRAVEHKGMSMVHIVSPCVTYQAMPWDQLKTGWEELPESHDREDKMEAFRMAYSRDPLYSGIFYEVDKPSLEERLKSQREAALESMDRDSYMEPDEIVHLFR